MIIEIPLLVVICIILWKEIYLHGKISNEMRGASSFFVILCHSINLIWLMNWYPNFDIKIESNYYLFSIVFACAVLFVFMKCEIALKLYILLVMVTFIAIRSTDLFFDKEHYLLYLALLEIGVPYLYLVAFRAR